VLLCAWSNAEAARYLQALFVWRREGVASIQARVDAGYHTRLEEALTSVEAVNKTDVHNLGSAFGSLRAVMDADLEELSLTPGLGARKIEALYRTFHAPLAP